MTRRPGRRERLYAWLAGKLIVRAATLAYARGDLHEFDHLRASLAAGNTSKTSHADGCLLAAYPDLLSSKEATGDRPLHQ